MGTLIFPLVNKEATRKTLKGSPIFKGGIAEEPKRQFVREDKESGDKKLSQPCIGVYGYGSEGSLLTAGLIILRLTSHAQFSFLFKVTVESENTRLRHYLAWNIAQKQNWGYRHNRSPISTNR